MAATGEGEVGVSFSLGSDLDCWSRRLRRLRRPRRDLVKVGGGPFGTVVHGPCMGFSLPVTTERLTPELKSTAQDLGAQALPDPRF